METGLAGKAVLVTGGSGGIGQAISRAFAEEGARVAIHYHRGHDAAQALAKELSGAVVVGADLSTVEGPEQCVAATVAALGGIDVLVHCAGIWPSPSVPLWEMDLERWEHTLRTDLTSAFLIAKAFLQRVSKQGHGNIVFIGSTAATFGEADHADYAAAKAGMVYGLTRSLKNEIVRIAPHGRVNVVSPGWTDTPLNRDSLADPTAVPRATRTMALDKIATPEDVAGQVVVLASDRLSGHVSGQVVVVAGGMEGRVIHELKHGAPAQAATGDK